CLLAGCATAQTGGTRPHPAPGGPCAYVPVDIDRYGRQPFQNPPEIRAQNGVLRTDLRVEYTDPRTTSLAGCPLTIRSYNGQLVGPTLRVRPGDVMAPVLHNRLPRESDAEVEAQYRQEANVAFLDMRPYSFNTTNLHTHGLHVSPSGNSDNVLLALPPGIVFPYDIRLPADHTRGSYWYHAHTHGSTAIQVGSAMAGALVVEDDPAQIPAALRAATEREKVMVIQTILYDTAGKSEDITAFFPDPGSGRNPACDSGGSGCTWLGSNRQVTINGQIVPVIRMRPGEVQRWRVVDGSFRETIGFRLQGHALHEIATDGIYTGRIDTWPDGADLVLYPGYRSDVLVQAGAPGTYQLLDDSTSGPNVELRGVKEDANLIGLLIVEGPPMDMRLPTAAEMAPLAPFAGVDLSTRAVRTQEAIFKLGASAQPGDGRNSFQINFEAFDENRVRFLQLDSVDMWSLTTVGDPAGIPSANAVPPLPHVFHIHINPFQVRRTGPTGQPQWVWKDTQIVPQGDTVTVWTQYTDFTGKFVIHCHILDHEDLGMMEVVEVVRELPRPHPRPEGRPGGGHGHAHGASASTPSPYSAPAQAAGGGPHRH
ncbi:MAG TPA: multicopper oxidase domain-containing protein, partial [Longimicrobium sp.]|nr:multicopper oxidase domain-containing protein [Longimicrobium sp.]